MQTIRKPADLDLMSTDDLKRLYKKLVKRSARKTWDRARLLEKVREKQAQAQQNAPTSPVEPEEASTPEPEPALVVEQPARPKPAPIAKPVEKPEPAPVKPAPEPAPVPLFLAGLLSRSVGKGETVKRSGEVVTVRTGSRIRAGAVMSDLRGKLPDHCLRFCADGLGVEVTVSAG